MGPRQMASLAFVGVVLLGAMSAVAYFAGRKNTASAEPPRVIERVIERVSASVPPASAVVPPVTKPVDPSAASPKPKTDEARPTAEVTAPAFHQMYLQAGSVEVGIAQVIVEGLRQRGVTAIVGIGINTKVARILVGPFSSNDDLRVAQKKIEDMGFHPFPRIFTEKDLEQQQITPLPASPAKP